VGKIKLAVWPASSQPHDLPALWANGTVIGAETAGRAALPELTLSSHGLLDAGLNVAITGHKSLCEIEHFHS
jgi:hypothetical protein